MGAGVSAGKNNDDLVDNLKEADYIKTPTVERVFRAVDRGQYYILTDPSINPYRDVAWKSGNLHISAPCIYSEVMEGLKLKPGMSFLNLGSGTGYFSTMAGLLLGSNGLNHGVELREEIVQYAIKKLDEFKRYSGALDEYDFCEPKFVVGNCLCLPSGGHLYDRVYCGAACTDSDLDYVKSLVKIGGVLIVPTNEQLMEMKRMSETQWINKALLPVSFASLVTPENSGDITNLVEIQPLSLQELCRSSIRNLLRKLVEKEHPSIKAIRRANKTIKKKKKRDAKRNRGEARATSNSNEEIFDYFMQLNRRRKEDSKCVRLEEETSSNSEDSNGANPLNSMRDVLMDMLGEFSRSDGPGTNDLSSTQANDEQEQETSNEVRTEVVVVEVNNQPGCSVESAHEEIDPAPASSEPKKNKNREKVDSGIGDELFSDIPNSIEMVETLTSSSEDEQDSKRLKRDSNERNPSSNWRRLDSAFVDDTGSDVEENDRVHYKVKMYKSPYSAYMAERIKELPLPSILKKYLHFYREF